MSTTATIKENNIKLQLTRVFDAPRELVFKAWTDANQFKQWFGAAACDGASLQSVKVDARVGGKYRLQVRRPDGEFFTTVGIYREVKPPERLVFTWQFEKDGSGDEFGEVEPPEMLVTRGIQSARQADGIDFDAREICVRRKPRPSRSRVGARCLDSLGKFVGK